MNNPGTLCIPRHEGSTFRGLSGLPPVAAEVILRREEPPFRAGKLPVLSTNPNALVNNAGYWVHQTFPEKRHFAWQKGYGAFTISVSGLDRVRRYVEGQEEHHRTVTFQEEYRGFLDRHKITYDESYIWD